MDFEFYIEDYHAVVKRYKGKNTKVIIPEQFNGFPVTEIEMDCFSNSKITSVTGKSIKSVGYIAFHFCESLTSISLPVCTSIGYSAFAYCTNLTEIDLPACEYVGDNAFRNCTSLTSINLPVCTYIGSFAFYSCLNLIKRGKYKATKIDLTCRDFKYEIGKWYEENEAILCEKEFNYVENFYDIFNYYWGKLGKNLRIFEVESEEISDEQSYDSKRVCKKIKLVKEIKSYNKMFDKEHDALDKS